MSDDGTRSLFLLSFSPSPAFLSNVNALLGAVLTSKAYGNTVLHVGKVSITLLLTATWVAFLRRVCPLGVLGQKQASVRL